MKKRVYISWCIFAASILALLMIQDNDSEFIAQTFNWWFLLVTMPVGFYSLSIKCGCCNTLWWIKKIPEPHLKSNSFWKRIFGGPHPDLSNISDACPKCGEEVRGAD